MFLAFSIIWGRRNGFGFPCSTLSCPSPPPLSPHFYLLYSSLSTWFSVFLSVYLLALVHLTLFLTCALRPYHFSLFSVIFFVTGATFTDPLTCSYHCSPWYSLSLALHLLILSHVRFSFYLSSWLHTSTSASSSSSLLHWIAGAPRTEHYQLARWWQYYKECKWGVD